MSLFWDDDRRYVPLRTAPPFDARWSRGTVRRVALLITVVAVFSAALGIILVGAHPAGADTTSLTGDESVRVPTGWWTYQGLTIAQVGDQLSAHGARITDLERAGPSTFNVVMVRNSGAYAVAGWAWYVGVSPSEAARLLGVKHMTPRGVGVSASNRWAVPRSPMFSAPRSWNPLPPSSRYTLRSR